MEAYKTLVLDAIKKSGKNTAPVPDDFSTFEGYTLWTEKYGNVSFAKTLYDIVKTYYSARASKERSELRRQQQRRQQRGRSGSVGSVDSASSSGSAPRGVAPSAPATAGATAEISLFLELKGAEDVGGDGKARNLMCRIEMGSIAKETEVIRGTASPKWEGHVRLPVKDLAQEVVISVCKQNSDGDRPSPIGRVVYKLPALISRISRERLIADRAALQPVKSGRAMPPGGLGFLNVEWTYEQNETVAVSPTVDASFKATTHLKNVQYRLLSSKADMKALYAQLHAAILKVEMDTQQSTLFQGGAFSAEAESMLAKIGGRHLNVGASTRAVVHLHETLRMYTAMRLPVLALKGAWASIPKLVDAGVPIASYDEPLLLQVLATMDRTLILHLTNFLDFFPAEMGAGQLRAALELCREIRGTPFYKEFANADADLPTSLSDGTSAPPRKFKDLVITLLNEGMNKRYNLLHETHAESSADDERGILFGLVALSEKLLEDLMLFKRFYASEFPKQIDLMAIACEVYLKHFTLEMMNMTMLSSGQVVVENEKTFKLMAVVTRLQRDFVPLAPQIRISFDIDQWFARFVFRWIETMAPKTSEWTHSAIRADAFVPQSESVHFSSSVNDLFAAIFGEVQFLRSLNWPNEVRLADFYSRFMSAVVVKAMDEYCDALRVGETRKDAAPATSWLPLALSQPLGAAQTGQQQQQQQTVNITTTTCVKLSNIEGCFRKLRELEKVLDVPKLVELLNRKASRTRQERKGGEPAADADAAVEGVTGNFELDIVHAENLRACDKSFVVVRRSGPGGEELARSRPVAATINPLFDETFQVSLEGCESLDVAVYNRNLILADSALGRRTFPLRRELCDGQVHDLWLDLDTQGKVLLRVAMEGSRADDILYAFRKAHKCLKRNREDFVRAMVMQIAPSIKLHLGRAIRDKTAPEEPGSIVASAGVSIQMVTAKLKALRGGGGDASMQSAAASADASTPVTLEEADEAIGPLFEYLDNNFGLLACNLSTKMAQYVIIKVWDELLTGFEATAVPPLYGAMHAEQRPLNVAQLSLLAHSVDLLMETFHGGGDGIGIPKDRLQSKEYKQLKSLFASYHLGTEKLQGEYLASVRIRRPKYYLLGLLRFRIDEAGVREFFEQALQERAAALSFT